MEIRNNPNFGKKRIDKKVAPEKQQQVSNESQLSEKEKTILAKIRSSAIASYAAALMAFSTLGSSCVQQSQETIINLDQEGIMALLTQLIALQQQTIDAINALKDSNSKENQEIIDNLQSINGVLTDISKGVIDIETGINEITDILVQQNENDAEFLEKIDKIYNSNLSQEEKLQQILEANQEQNAFLINIAPFIKAIAETNQDAADTIQAFYEAYLDGELSHSEFMQKMLAYAEKEVSISSDTLEEVRQIKEELKNGNIQEAEALKRITELLLGIDSKLGDIAVILKEIEKVVNDVNNNVISIDEGVEQLYDIMEKHFAYDAELMAKLDQIYNSNYSQEVKLQKILEEQEKHTEMLKNIEPYIHQIAEIDKNSAEVLKEFYAAYLDGEMSRAEFMEKMLAVAEKQTGLSERIVDEIVKTRESVERGDKAEFKALQEIQYILSSMNLELDQISAVLNDIENGVTDIKTGILVIVDMMEKAYANDQELLAKLDQIYNSNFSQEVKLDKILKENEKQTAFLAEIEPYIQTIAKFSKESAAILKEFYAAYMNGEITRSEFMERMLAEAEKQNVISGAILKEIQALRSEYNAGNLEEAELLARIEDILISIDGKMDVVIDKLDEISGNIVDLSNKLDNNNDKIYNKLAEIGIDIKEGNAISQQQMAELVRLAKEGNKTAVEILANMDGMKDVLIDIRDKDGNMDIRDLLVKYGDQIGEDFETVIALLKSFDPTVRIEDIDQIINAINNAKPDLSKIQEQLGTIIVLMQRAQASDISAEDLKAIADQIAALRESNEAGAAITNANLAQILADMTKIEGMLEIIVDVQGETLDTLQKYAASTEVSFENLTDGMMALVNGQLTAEQMDALLAKYRTDLGQVELSMGQAVQLLQAILDAQGQGGGSSTGGAGLTPEQIADVINNSEIFNEIADLLKDLNVDRVTNQTLNSALAAHKTDLSKVQEQLGTVIVLLQRTQSSNVQVDTSKLESAVNALADVVTNQGVTSNAGIQDVKAELAEMIEYLKSVLGQQ